MCGPRDGFEWRTAHCDELNDKDTKGGGGRGGRFIKTLIISSAEALIE